jgi:hypothetical protein
MKAEILKIAGVKSDKEFYKKFPTEEAFMKKHGKEFKKAQGGVNMSFFDTVGKTMGNIMNQARNFKPRQEFQPQQFMQQQQPAPQAMQFFNAPVPADTQSAWTPPPKKDNQQLAQTIGKYAGQAGKIVQGVQALREEREQRRRAEQWAGVSDVVRQASESRDVDANRGRRYVREEEMVTTGYDRFPMDGVSTNVLTAKNGAEIANTFAPNTLYDDLGYEPLEDSKRVKQFKGGGQLLNELGEAGVGDMASQFITGIGGENAGGNLGGSIGGTIGSIFGPGGQMIGQVGGQILGALLNKNPQRIAKATEKTATNLNAATFGNMGRGFAQQNTSFMENGGWVSHDWQPQEIVKFGEYQLSDLLKPDPTMDTLRSGGHLKEYTPPSEAAMSTERPSFAMGGELQTHWGGYAEPMSYNPYLPEGGETVMFRGQSHDESDGKGRTGIGVTYGESEVEVERGEPAIKMKEGGGAPGENSMVVFGNLKIPDNMLGDPKAKGLNFKKYVANLSKEEARANKSMEKAVSSLDNLDPSTPYDRLKMNSLTAAVNGANMKLKDIADKKMSAASLQSAMNYTIEKFRLKTTDRGTISAKQGASIEKAQDGKKYSKKATTPGYIDYNPLGTESAEEFKDKASYEKLWMPKVESVFSDKEKAKLIIDKLEKYQGQDAADVVDLIKKGKTLEEKIKIAKKNASDGKPGPYHELIREMITTSDAPKVVPQTPAAQPVVTPTPKKDDASTTTIPTTTKYDLLRTLYNEVLPFLRPSDAEPLDPRQLAGEMYAMSTNQLEPVRAQTFQPELGVPYDISLQDMLNENEAAFRSQQRIAGYNPAAQSMLNAQKYKANQQVLGEQFRMNQAMKDRVYGENRALLNQAKLQNLGIFDTQYVRQEEAKSKTKAIPQAVLNSMSAKYAQNQLENRQLQVMENMYNYRFDPRFRAMNMNPLQDFQSQIDAVPVVDENGNVVQFRTTTKKDKYGRPTGSSTTVTQKPKETGRNGAIAKAFRNL